MTNEGPPVDFYAASAAAAAVVVFAKAEKALQQRGRLAVAVDP
jgi:hypothetical protein